MPEEPEPSAIPSFVSQALAATERVHDALAREFEKTPTLDWLFERLGGMVHYAAQKLIDMKGKGGASNALDEATIISCSRLFNACFSGYALLSRGLVLDALVLLRSAYELTTQGEAFFERPELAQRWLNGKRIAPREVRQVSPLAMSSKQLYDRLARSAHPNIVASAYHVTPIDAGTVLAYGGTFRPKAAGQVACQLLWAELTFLDTFYRHNSARLTEFNLLWRRATYETLTAGGAKPEEALAAGWEPVLAVLRSVLEALTEH
ncbi:MAG: hypothetical protein ACYC9X_13020, partial [Dehalococcoidia bacterium]